MYPVSEAFLDAIQKNTRNYHWEGMITTVYGKQIPFSSRDIVKGSGYLVHQCCGNTEVEIATVYSAELGITIFSDADRYAMEGAVVHISFFLKIQDDKFESVPMGVYEVCEANRKGRCLEIKAYDCMLRFDRKIQMKASSGTAYDLLQTACGECDVVMEQTQEEIEQMENGRELLGIYSDENLETWRDLVAYTAQVLGCFATINRTGNLELRRYGIQPVWEIKKEHRFNTSISDFVTRYTSVSSTNKRTSVSEYYALDTDDGLTMNLGINPLLQFGLEETRERLLRNILNCISGFQYVPFDSDTIGNPALDLGDCVTLSGGSDTVSAVTSFQCRIHGCHTLKCVGKNPRLSIAKSKNDKNISGLLNQIEAGKNAVSILKNSQELHLGNIETALFSMEFVTNEETDVQFHASVLLDVDPDTVVREAAAENLDDGKVVKISWEESGEVILRLRYVLDGTEISGFSPEETWGKGKHVLSLYYPMAGLEQKKGHTFQVLADMKYGTARIERGWGIGAAGGQGIQAQENWNGQIKAEESITGPDIGKFVELCGIREQSRCVFEVPEKVPLSEACGVVQAGKFHMVPLLERMEIENEQNE